jgi:lysozyme family protein
VNDFDKCLSYTLNEEGGYAELAGDEITNHGVQKSTWEDWVGHKVTKEDMKQLSQSDVKPVYKERYWDVARCQSLWYPLNLCVFDFAVHSGPKTASSQLQFAVGVQRDGIIGPKTLKAINDLPKKEVIERYMQKRLEYASSAKLWNLYRKGWEARFNRLKKFALSELKE